MIKRKSNGVIAAEWKITRKPAGVITRLFMHELWTPGRAWYPDLSLRL